MKGIGLTILLAFTITCKGQDSTVYNVYNLQKFGVVYIPNTLDTIGQGLAKSQILQSNIEKLSKSSLNRVSKRYNVNLSQSLLENNSKESYFFWPIKSMLAILDSRSWKYDKDSVFGFDESLIEFIPSITLRKVPVKGTSADFKKYFFFNKDTATKFARKMETMLSDVYALMYPESKILETNSGYYFISEQFPVVRVSIYLSIPINDMETSIGQITYMVYKGNNIYSLKFEFKSNEREVWEKRINEIMSKCVFL